MAYMGRQAARRREPSRILDGASRAVVVTRNYYNADTASRPGHGHVAKYARGRDYHAALEDPLEQLAQYIVSLGSRDTLARAYVDAGPVPERELAQRAGLGWIGKNTMLIDPGRGSFIFLASVLTDLDLALDQPFEVDRCGSCTRCIQACPTDAFPSDRVLDSRRCISYLTIERRGDIDLELHPAMGGPDFRLRRVPGRLPLEPEVRPRRRRSGVGAERYVGMARSRFAGADERFRVRGALRSCCSGAPRCERHAAQRGDRSSERGKGGSVADAPHGVTDPELRERLNRIQQQLSTGLEGVDPHHKLAGPPGDLPGHRGPHVRDRVQGRHQHH